MKPANLDAVNRSFAIQAPSFESGEVRFAKEEYIDFMISCVGPNKWDTVLEVASGTCVCGRAFASLVQSVVCLDATPAMLQIAILHSLRWCGCCGQEVSW